MRISVLLGHAHRKFSARVVYEEGRSPCPNNCHWEQLGEPGGFAGARVVRARPCSGWSKRWRGRGSGLFSLEYRGRARPGAGSGDPRREPPVLLDRCHLARGPAPDRFRHGRLFSPLSGPDRASRFPGGLAEGRGEGPTARRSRSRARRSAGIFPEGSARVGADGRDGAARTGSRSRRAPDNPGDHRRRRARMAQSRLLPKPAKIVVPTPADPIDPDERARGARTRLTIAHAARAASITARSPRPCARAPARALVPEAARARHRYDGAAPSPPPPATSSRAGLGTLARAGPASGSARIITFNLPTSRSPAGPPGEVLRNSCRLAHPRLADPLARAPRAEGEGNELLVGDELAALPLLLGGLLHVQKSSCRRRLLLLARALPAGRTRSGSDPASRHALFACAKGSFTTALDSVMLACLVGGMADPRRARRSCPSRCSPPRRSPTSRPSSPSPTTSGRRAR